MSSPRRPPPAHDPYRIAITGASGVLGASIADCLEGTARALKISLPGLPMRIERISRRRGVDLHRLEEILLRRNPDGTRIGDPHSFDEVIHCAATPYEPGRYSDYEIMVADLELTLAALRVASESARDGVLPRFTYLSCIDAYSESAPGTAFDRPRPLLESDTSDYPAPVSPIGMSKLASEMAIRAWSKSTGGVHTIFRLNDVISPYAPHDRPGRIVTDIYRRLFIEQVPELQLGIGGMQVRAFSWFEDVVCGIVDLPANPASDNQTFNLGSDTPTSIAELANAMLVVGLELGLLPDTYVPAIVYDYDGRGARNDVRIPSTTKAKELLGWEHKTALTAMLEKFLRTKAETAHVMVSP